MGLKKKKEKIIYKLENGKFQPGIHLILLSTSGRNHMEIVNSALLLQPKYPQKDLLVAGIAKSYDGALELVEKIFEEVYDKTKGTDICNYILEKEQG